MKPTVSAVFNRTCQIALILALLLTLAPLQPATAQTAAQAGGEFEPDECMFDLPPGTTRLDPVQCGYVTVPAEHANPAGQSIRLAVVILKSTSQNPAPDPLFVAQGGPGGSTIDTYAPHLMDHRLRRERDIVLFDQRGTLYSQPALYCSEVDQLTVDTLDQDLSPEESERLNLEAMRACRERLVREGIDLSAFDSIENAADIDLLRQALGYDKINLYGVSYGTLLALHYMRQFPDTLRSVVLDGVVPPQTNFILKVAQTEDQAFTRLFSACQADAQCSADYPNLEQVFFEVVDRLNETPARVILTDPDTQQSYPNSVINGDTFHWLTFQFLYVADIIPTLPRMIYDARAGDFQLAERILAILLFDRSTSYGMYYSVLCAEDADFVPQDQDLTGVRPQVARIEERGPQVMLDTCQVWDVEPLGAQVDEPVQSDVPTLLLSGGFDPITPAAYAETVAATLSNHYAFVFPAGGHGQLLDGDCPDGLIQAFLNNPNKSPDAACIQDHPAPAFITSRTVIDMPDLLKMLNLDSSATARFLILIVGLLFLLTAILVFPIAWLFNRMRAKPAAVREADRVPPSAIENDLAAAWQAPGSPAWQDPPPAPASIWRRLSSWTAVLQGLLLGIFLTALTFVIVRMVSENDNRLFYGLAGEARPWFVLPVLFALLSLAMLVMLIMMWARREGSLARRLYYALLTLTALVCTGVMASLGMLSGLF